MKREFSPRYRAVRTLNGFGVQDRTEHRLTHYAAQSANRNVNETIVLMMQTIAGLLTENDTEALEKYNQYKVHHGTK